MHFEPLKDVDAEYPMTAVFQKTAPQPTGPWAVPGDYSVVLTAGGKSFTQPLPVKMDPRVKASPADLTKQFELSKALYETRRTLQPIGKAYESLVAELAKAKEKAGEKPVKEQIEALNRKLQEFADPARVRAGQSLELDVLSKVEKLFGDLQEVDAAPTKPSADLAKQFELSKALYDTRVTLQPIGKSFESLVAELAKAKEKAGDKPVKEKIEALNKKLQEFADPERVRAGQPLELDVLAKVEKLFGDLQEVDAGPTSATEAASVEIQRDAKSATERWRASAPEVAALNSALEMAGLEKIKFP